MPLGILPIMTQQEANCLLKAGLEPIEWMSPRMISEFWNISKAAINQAKYRGVFDKVEQVRLVNKTFWRKFEIIVAYAPEGVPEEKKFEILKGLKDQIQEEKESGIYDFSMSLASNVALPKSTKKHFAENQEKRDARPRVGEDVPESKSKSKKQKLMPEPKPKLGEGFLKEASRYPARKKFEKDYLEAMADVVTLHDWEQIIVTAINQAVRGDAKARSWISENLLGKPLTRIAAVQKVESSVMGEDERFELMNEIFASQVRGGGILDVEPINTETTIKPDDGTIDAHSTEIDGRNSGKEHVVGSPFEE